MGVAVWSYRLDLENCKSQNVSMLADLQSCGSYCEQSWTAGDNRTLVCLGSRLNRSHFTLSSFSSECNFSTLSQQSDGCKVLFLDDRFMCWVWVLCCSQDAAEWCVCVWSLTSNWKCDYVFGAEIIFRPAAVILSPTSGRAGSAGLDSFCFNWITWVICHVLLKTCFKIIMYWWSASLLVVIAALEIGSL